ncbi:hypothetical protein K438DRAFT_1836109, partial [Mycena galopus ATCC 62051]
MRAAQARAEDGDLSFSNSNNCRLPSPSRSGLVPFNPIDDGSLYPLMSCFRPPRYGALEFSCRCSPSCAAPFLLFRCVAAFLVSPTPPTSAAFFQEDLSMILPVLLATAIGLGQNWSLTVRRRIKRHYCI